jgi:8-oxo-dGTP pyrophosphatase MutT (NUDIX family)
LSNALSARLENLRLLLDQYGASVAELPAVREILELIDAGDVTFSADHFHPGHVTASGFVVDGSRSRLLLIHHARLGEWLQPGGHVDPGEEVLAAAIREVQEETGVVGIPMSDGIFDVDVHPIPPSGTRPAHNHYDVRFLLEAADEGLAPSEEVLGARWVPLADVATLVTDRSVLRAVEKLV